jgi:transcriptional regulator with XRE-family HTH domain
MISRPIAHDPGSRSEQRRKPYRPKDEDITSMVRKVAANGTRIKELRTHSSSELPQKKLAKLCGISERQLRRIENENLPVSTAVLRQLALHLNAGVDQIAFSVQGPSLVAQQDSVATPSKTVANEPRIIPRHTTTHLKPVSTAQALYDLAEGSMEVVPHLLLDAPAAQMAMIEECLSLLKAVSDRKWSLGPVPADVHDSADFPEISRRTRLTELFVLLKGHDIRIVAESEIYTYPPGAQPWLEGEKFCFQLVVAFAPPRGEYDEAHVVVPFDAGREFVLDLKKPLPF